MSCSQGSIRPDAPGPAGPPLEAPAMPLALASVGQEVRFVGVRAGRQLQHRLAEMGLTPGSAFRILAKDRFGPLIILLGETRLMLGHGMVQKVMVRPV